MRYKNNVVFFDLQSIGFVSRSGVPPYPLSSVQIFPDLRRAISQLTEARLGVILHGCDEPVSGVIEVIDWDQSSSRLDRKLFVGQVDLREPLRLIFERALSLAEVDAEVCLYVSDDAVKRRSAMALGLRVCPHALLVQSVLSGEDLCYLQLAISSLNEHRLSVIRQLPLVPLKVASGFVYVVSTLEVVPLLAQQGVEVERLEEGDPKGADLCLLRVPLGDTGATWSMAGRRSAAVSLSNGRPVYGVKVVASGYVSAASSSVASGFPHLDERMLPDPGLLNTLAADSVGAVEPSREGLSDEEKVALSRIDHSSIRVLVEKYSGASPIRKGSEERIESRHRSHHDNLRAVHLLASDLLEAGRGELEVRLCPFSYKGRTLYNVEGELGRKDLEEIVIVSAHLDSTADLSGHYKEHVCPAPGADDDASGVAAVLVIAKIISDLSIRSSLARRVRFLLFNAEEDAKDGSKAYACSQAALGAKIVAVYHMDMIGYNKLPPQSFGMHAGHRRDSEVQRRSLLLAGHTLRIVREVSSGLGMLKIYPSGSVSDPFEDSSDDVSFKERNYPACLVAEDLVDEFNPNYHMYTDNVSGVDFVYAANIARAVAASAWLLSRA